MKEMDIDNHKVKNSLKYKIKSLKREWKQYKWKRQHKMQNTQWICILCTIVFILNFLIDEQNIAAKRHVIERETTEIYQSRYLKNPLTLKWKSKNDCIKWKLNFFEGERFDVCSQRREDIVNSFKINMEQI